MSQPEIQRDAAKLMTIQSILIFQRLDPRVKQPLLDVQELLVVILRDDPPEDFR